MARRLVPTPGPRTPAVRRRSTTDLESSRPAYNTAINGQHVRISEKVGELKNSEHKKARLAADTGRMPALHSYIGRIGYVLSSASRETCTGTSGNCGSETATG